MSSISIKLQESTIDSEYSLYVNHRLIAVITSPIDVIKLWYKEKKEKELLLKHFLFHDMYKLSEDMEHNYRVTNFIQLLESFKKANHIIMEGSAECAKKILKIYDKKYR